MEKGEARKSQVSRGGLGGREGHDGHEGRESRESQERCGERERVKARKAGKTYPKMPNKNQISSPLWTLYSKQLKPWELAFLS